MKFIPDFVKGLSGKTASTPADDGPEQFESELPFEIDTADAISNILPPSRLGLFREMLALFELPKLVLRFPELARQPRGSGQKILVIPGYSTDDKFTYLLRLYLKFLGYHPIGWGMGVNNGKVPAVASALIKMVGDESDHGKHRLILIGWSLGGYLAREIARETPKYISQVITLGSPVVGGPKYTAIATEFQKRGYDLDEVEKQVEARDKNPLTIPVTAIYSRNDHIVAWEACIDQVNKQIHHVEVQTTHFGLIFAPEVFIAIARILAAGAGGEEKTPSIKSARARPVLTGGNAKSPPATAGLPHSRK